MCRFCTSQNPLQEALNNEKRCKEFLWGLELGISTVEDDAPLMILENALESQARQAEEKDEEVTRVKQEIENLTAQLAQKTKELQKAKLENRLDNIILWVLADSIVKFGDQIEFEEKASDAGSNDSGHESWCFSPIDEYEELVQESTKFDFKDKQEWPSLCA
jgi:hypothetical protein